MLSRIVRHEWRALIADATTWVVVVVFGLAIGYGVWNGARWVAFQRAALATAAEEEAERYARLETQMAAVDAGATVSPFADPRSPANIGGRLGPRYATLPPARWRRCPSVRATCCPTLRIPPMPARTSSRRPRSRTRSGCSSAGSTSPSS